MPLSTHKQAFIKTINSFRQVLPTILGVILFISLSITIIPKSFYSSIFSGNHIIDPVFGAMLGSIAAGNPITSYIIGGELLKQDISLIAITAFIVAWVTVGMVQFPAEAIMLGRRFAILRNVISFLFSIIVAVITVYITLAL